MKELLDSSQQWIHPGISHNLSNIFIRARGFLMSQYCYFLQICYEFKMRAFNQDGLYFFSF